MIKQVEEVILLVDSSKFHRRGGMIICPLERITHIITDDGIDAPTLNLFEQAGVPVTIASPDNAKDLS
jgi:DeoR family ulaG and ulaABCDEF operon transcriptional repressor